MYKKNKIVVVVPAFNEEEHILDVINTVPDFVDNVVVVDDASTDDTHRLASTSKDERVIVIKHKINQGVGGAIVTGHKKALDANADISVVMAGDGQMNPSYLSKLLDPLTEGGYHYTKGNRFLRKGSLKGMPKLRVLGNMILTFLTKLSSGYWSIFDPQNGYTAIKAEALNELELDTLAKRYEFENDMLINLNIGNFRVKDVSIPSAYAGEKSGIKLHKFIPHTSFFLLKGLFRRIYQKYMLRDFHPIALLLLSGLFLLAWGFLYGLYIIYLSIGPPMASTASVMLAVLPFLIGFMLLLAAFLLDIIESPK